MKYKVVLRNEVKEDILHNSVKYASIDEKIAESFLERLDTTIDSIEQEALGGEIIYKNIRRMLVKRFPYGLFYIVEKEKVIVMACLDLRQDPLKIKAILEGLLDD